MCFFTAQLSRVQRNRPFTEKDVNALAISILSGNRWSSFTIVKTQRRALQTKLEARTCVKIVQKNICTSDFGRKNKKVIKPICHPKSMKLS